LTQSLLPSSLYSQKPATHSITSGAAVLKVRVAGKMTPTDSLVPLAVVMAWLMHLPSKNTLALVVMLTLSIFSVVMVTTKANVYFDGKCVSHGLTLADGTKLSVGVILPATLTFNTGAPEIMECVGGFCEYKLDGSNDWVKSSAGEKFNVPGNSKFDIRVTEPYHYICHFG